MKVAVLSPSLSRTGGGIFEIERALAVTMQQQGCDVGAFGLADDATEADRARWSPVPVRAAPIKGPRAFGYAPDLRRELVAWHPDIVHLHALWMYTSVLARGWSRRTGKPFITTVHGMLDPWAFRNSRLKKRVALALFERAALREAACLHVNTVAELDAVRALGIPGPFCVVPNGVFLPDLTGPPRLGETSPLFALERAGAKVLLYLGRLHPKKNVGATIAAFAEVAPRHADWRFAIAGWGSDEYRAELERQVAEAGLSERVIFLGPLHDQDRDAALAAADAFVLASHSEGLPMAVLEAMAHARPVLLTPMCNLQPAVDAGAALSIDVAPDSIAAGLEQMFAASDAERAEMGRRGRALVERDYSWEHVAAELVRVYRWALGGGERPASLVG